MTSSDLIRQAKESMSPLSAVPSSHRVVLTCMDTRIDPLAALGLQLGQAHILRNAGGIVTDDVIRSLIVSQRALDTTRIDVMMHTECGMIGLDEDAIRAAIAAETGIPFRHSLGSFPDLKAELQRGVELLRGTHELADAAHIRGYIFDVATRNARIFIS